MNRHTEHKAGLTLVELLVVIAIISLLAAIAVPNAVKMMGNVRDSLERSGRTVYSYLLAARANAVTLRRDTAVFYVLREVQDSRDESNVQLVAEAVGHARRVTLDELEEVDYFGETDTAIRNALRTRAFVLLESDGSRMVNLEYETAIPAQVTEVIASSPRTQEAGQLLDEDANGRSLQGLMLIRVYRLEKDSDGVLVWDRLDPYYDLSGWFGTGTAGLIDGLFPAHVFRPTGELMTDGEPVSIRHNVRVSVSPIAGVRTRFMDPDDPETPEREVAGVHLEINRLSGRVQFVGHRHERLD